MKNKSECIIPRFSIYILYLTQTFSELCDFYAGSAVEMPIIQCALWKYSFSFIPFFSIYYNHFCLSLLGTQGSLPRQRNHNLAWPSYHKRPRKQIWKACSSERLVTTAGAQPRERDRAPPAGSPTRCQHESSLPRSSPPAPSTHPSY